MAIDFPNSPTIGQIFTTTTGQVYTWDGVKWVPSATSQAALVANPNKLVNPFMEIDQANEGALLSGIVGSTNSIDGWFGAGNSATVSLQRVADAPPGFLSSIRLTVTTAGAQSGTNNTLIGQRIEGDELIDTALSTTSALTLSASWWAKSSQAGVYSLSITNAGTTRSYVVPFTISAANVWQLFTTTIPGDTAAGWTTSGNAAQLFFRVIIGAGATVQTASTNTWLAGNFTAPTNINNTLTNTTSATFQLGPCGLWVSPVPQPLLRTSIQAELARCQRYYEKSYSPGTVPGTAGGGGSNGIMYSIGAAMGAGTQPLIAVPWKITKRASPTVTVYDGAGTIGKYSYYNGAWVNGGTANLYTNNMNGTNVGFASIAASTTQVGTDFVADARL